MSGAGPPGAAGPSRPPPLDHGRRAGLVPLPPPRREMGPRIAPSAPGRESRRAGGGWEQGDGTAERAAPAPRGWPAGGALGGRGGSGGFRSWKGRAGRKRGCVRHACEQTKPRMLRRVREFAAVSSVRLNAEPPWTPFPRVTLAQRLLEKWEEAARRALPEVAGSGSFPPNCLVGANLSLL